MKILLDKRKRKGSAPSIVPLQVISHTYDLENSVDITEISRQSIFVIERAKEIETLRGLLRRHPVVGIIGARQVGKTTLSRSFIGKTRGPSSFFDLENPEDSARLRDPMLALKGLRGIVVIDEIQRHPELFPVLRVLADRPNTPAFWSWAAPRPNFCARVPKHLPAVFTITNWGDSLLMRLELKTPCGCG